MDQTLNRRCFSLLFLVLPENEGLYSRSIDFFKQKLPYPGSLRLSHTCQISSLYSTILQSITKRNTTSNTCHAFPTENPNVQLSVPSPLPKTTPHLPSPPWLATTELPQLPLPDPFTSILLRNSNVTSYQFIPCPQSSFPFPP